QSLPEWTEWKLAEDVYDASGTNLVVRAFWGLSTNVAKLTALGLRDIRIFDSRPKQKHKLMTAVWNDHEGRYEPYLTTNKYWLKSDESPAVTERLETLVNKVE